MKMATEVKCLTWAIFESKLTFNVYRRCMEEQFIFVNYFSYDLEIDNETLDKVSKRTLFLEIEPMVINIRLEVGDLFKVIGVQTSTNFVIRFDGVSGDKLTFCVTKLIL